MKSSFYRGDEEMFVVVHSSGPVMHGRTEGMVKHFTRTFANAVAKYGKTWQMSSSGVAGPSFYASKLCGF
jgi:hypothetical protein